jgi:hypothetical protein
LHHDDGDTPCEKGNLYQLPITDLRPDPDQPRKVIDPAALEDLKDSIREYRIITPILFHPAGGADFTSVPPALAYHHHRRTLLSGSLAAWPACRTGQMQLPLINLGIEPSQKLLPLTTRERKLKTCEIVSEWIDTQDAPRLAIDNTEIIFDPSLTLNPPGRTGQSRHEANARSRDISANQGYRCVQADTRYVRHG